MDIKLRNKLIKKSLSQVYNPKDVSVRGETGSAYGWVIIKVTIDRPEGCRCNWKTEFNKYTKQNYTFRAPLVDGVRTSRSSYMCEKCLSRHQAETQRMDEIIHGCGAEFYHYTSDDGYNIEREEYIAEIEIR
jgi:hypothetical protein